jgi:hypothetical protein
VERRCPFLIRLFQPLPIRAGLEQQEMLPTSSCFVPEKKEKKRIEKRNADDGNGTADVYIP